jgi:outer membrane protein assembly factor BamB
MAQQALVYVGIKGTVVALDRATGQEVWRRPLAGADFVNVTVSGGDLMATARGEVYSLDAATGEVRWHNPLKGLGRGLVTIAPCSQIAVSAEKKRRDAQDGAAAAAAASS